MTDNLKERARAELVQRVRKELFANLAHYRQHCISEQSDAETVANFIESLPTVSVEARNGVIDTDVGRVPQAAPGSSSLRSPEPAAPSRPLRGDDPSRGEARPDCDICGQPYHRHNEAHGVRLCPIFATYRPKREA